MIKIKRLDEAVKTPEIETFINRILKDLKVVIVDTIKQSVNAKKRSWSKDTFEISYGINGETLSLIVSNYLYKNRETYNIVNIEGHVESGNFMGLQYRGVPDGNFILYIKNNVGVSSSNLLGTTKNEPLLEDEVYLLTSYVET